MGGRPPEPVLMAAGQESPEESEWESEEESVSDFLKWSVMTPRPPLLAA